jgi:hypothetical protein
MENVGERIEHGEQPECESLGWRAIHVLAGLLAEMRADQRRYEQLAGLVAEVRQRRQRCPWAQVDLSSYSAGRPRP